jgi:hypothetical protein
MPSPICRICSAWKQRLSRLVNERVITQLEADQLLHVYRRRRLGRSKT